MLKLTEPHIILSYGITEIIVIFLLYYLTGYGSITFFHFGPPLTFLQTEITSWWSFSWILMTFFIHQISYCIIYERVQPWIFNEIQNAYCADIRYTKPIVLILINLYYIIMTMNSVFIVAGITAQFSFVFITIVAQALASTYINYKYMKDKEDVENVEDTTINDYDEQGEESIKESV